MAEVYEVGGQSRFPVFPQFEVTTPPREEQREAQRTEREEVREVRMEQERNPQHTQVVEREQRQVREDPRVEERQIEEIRGNTPNPTFAQEQRDENRARFVDRLA